MKKQLLLFVEATAVLFVGAWIAIGFGAALIAVAIAMFVLYAILLNQRYHQSWVRNELAYESAERKHELELVRASGQTITPVLTNTDEVQYCDNCGSELSVSDIKNGFCKDCGESI